MFDGLIPYGVVDSRSILDVQPADLEGFTQCHFFCGIAGWAYALKLAGWPATRPVWTGSPPCQPFSAAGKLEGKDDARHIAPHFISLVGACRPPPVLFGEQVASAAVFGKSAKRVGGEPEWSWLDDLSDRLEAAHYAVGASDIPASVVGAPHIRQRTFFGAVRLADATSAGLERSAGQGIQGRSDRYACSSQSERLADANGRDACAEREQRSGQQRLKPQDGGPERLGHTSWATGERDARCVSGTQAQEHGERVAINGGMPVGPKHAGAGVGGLEHPAGNGRQQRGAEPSGRGLDAGCGPERLADADKPGSQGRQGMPQRPVECAAGSGGLADSQPPSGTDHGGWEDVDWLFCRDGKWRPVKSSVQRVAPRIPGSVCHAALTARLRKAPKKPGA